MNGVPINQPLYHPMYYALLAACEAADKDPNLQNGYELDLLLDTGSHRRGLVSALRHGVIVLHEESLAPVMVNPEHVVTAEIVSLEDCA